MLQGSKPEYAAPALAKGLDILELLASIEGGLTQNEIAEQLGRTTSEIFRMLEVLSRRTFIRREEDGTYRLTLKLFELAHRHAPVKRLVATAVPVMQRLSRAIGQSTHICVHYDRRILVIAQVDSSEPMNFSVRLGSHYPFGPDHGSALVLAAFQPAEERAALMAEMAANHPRLNLRALQKEMMLLGKRGYYQSPSAVIGGVIQVSAPIFSNAPGAIASLASPFLRQREVKVSLSDARKALVKAAEDISARLGANVR